ncbi:restriction endonuclease subunit S [Bacillus cereus]
MKYEHVILGDMVTFQKGFVFKSKDFTNYGIPVVKVSNFIEDTVDMSSCEMLPNSFYETNKRYSLEEDEILIATVGSWPTNPNSVVGRVVRVPKLKEVALLNQNIVKITSNSDLLNNDFLYYLLKSKTFKDYLVSTAQGSANQASITLESIKKFNFELPPIDAQYKIAHFLKTMDKKIKTNKQIINSLEQLSQTLFKHWFIDFEFPNEQGHSYKLSGGEMVESELGEIPKRWTVDTLSSISEIVMGQSPKSDTYNTENQGLPLLNGAADFKNRQLNPSKYTSDPKKVGEKGEFVFGVRATIGLVTELDGNYAIGRGAGIAKPSNDVFKEFLYEILNKAFNDFKYTASGSVYLNISKNDLKDYKLILPTHEIMNKYHEATKALLVQKENLIQENRSLEALRDILLPKLLSGESEIPDELVVD